MAAATELTLDQAYQLALRCAASGDFPQAERLCRLILDASPAQPQALRLLAHIAMQMHQPDVAIQCLIRCAAVTPQDADLRIELGNAMFTIGRTEEAAASYRYAVDLRPDDPSALGNLGIALFTLDQHKEAIESLSRAVSLAPARADLLNNLGHALRDAGKFSESIKILKQAIAQNPDWIEPKHNLAIALKHAGLIDDAIRVCQDAMKSDSSAASIHSTLLSLLLLQENASPGEIFDAHREWNRTHAGKLASTTNHPNERHRDRKLRIGYVSPTLREHATSYFVEYLLACHDTDRFEIYCYADLQRRPGAVSERLKAHAQHWRNATGLSDAQLDEAIRADQIDVLIDLAGHTPGNRLLVFARKPAPVQISYLGHPATTGLDAMDGYLTDATIDPPGATDDQFAERLLRLPRIFASYRPPADAPAITALPSLKRKFITFAALGQISKINRSVVHTWSEILGRLPRSRLLIQSLGLTDPLVSGRFLEQFRHYGIDADRIELRDCVSGVVKHLSTYHDVDLSLDTFPCNGMTSTCESLWMGVPVISLAGQMHASRIGASLLQQVGLGSCIADTRDKYIELAMRLASDPSQLSELRKTLRERMRQSPLMAGIRFARDVEAEYRTLWRTWCERK